MSVRVACDAADPDGVGRVTPPVVVALDGTDHESHAAQASMIRRYIIWRNRNADDKALRELVKRANVA